MAEAVIAKRCSGAVARSVLRIRRRLVALYAVATSADALTTYVGTSLGAVEANPLVAVLFSTFGIERVLIVLSLLAVVLYYFMVSVPHPFALRLGVAHVLARLVVVVHNTAIIFGASLSPVVLLAVVPILLAVCARVKNHIFSASELRSTLRLSTHKAPNLLAQVGIFVL